MTVELTRWERLMLLRILPAVVFVAAVVVVGLAVLVQSTDDDIDSLSASVASVERSTTRVRDFVDDLETETPEEQAQNAAVTAAVRQVPEIKAILCEQFPDAVACRGT